MVTILFDALPVGALVSLVAEEVLLTAVAARNVCFEKQSFKQLSEYLKHIHFYLIALSKRKLEGIPAASNALRQLQGNVKKADALIKKVTNNSPLYNLVCCRTIVKDFESAVKDIGLALRTLQLAIVEISVDINEAMEQMNEQMLRAEYRASKENLEIVDELKRGLDEQRSDRKFANDIVVGIARSLGLSVPSEISRELASLQRDKEEAATTKELQEKLYLEQVIALLSRADAAYSWEESAENYGRRKELVANCNDRNIFLEPYHSFRCPFTKEIMTDPVSAANQKTYERRFIERWFEEGNSRDPDTGEELPNTDLRPNRTLLETITEWKEQNYVARILLAKTRLQSGSELQQTDAFLDLSKLCEESFVNKDWIAFEGLIPLIVEILSSCSHDLKERTLSALYCLVKDNERNQELVVNAKGVGFAIKCLGRKLSVAKAAVMLLAELLNNGSARAEMEREPTFFLWLVTRRLDKEDAELVMTTSTMLDRLSNDDKNIVEMAKVKWCSPLVHRLCRGPDDSRLAMASALSNIDLDDRSKQVIAEADAVPQLIKMAGSKDSIAKAAALRALQNLSSHSQVKKCIAEAGGVPMLLSLFSNRTLLAQLEEPASAILENLVVNDGMKYLIDINGTSIQEEDLVKQLLGELEFSSLPVVRLHALNTLSALAHASNARKVRKLITENLDVSLLLSFIEHAQSEARDSAVWLLFHLCEEGGAQIAPFLRAKETLGLLVELMRNNLVSTSVQGAAAGIIAHIPLDDRAAKFSLVAAHTLDALVGMLASHDANAVESALGALLRFTDPSDVEMQLHLAQLEIFSHLNEMLRSGPAIAKIRAATALKNLSLSTPRLSEESSAKGFTCFWRPSLCRVHKGKCEAKTTLCILEANAVPQLVTILHDPDAKVAEAGIDALFTLFVEDGMVEKAVRVLHDAVVMKPLLHLVTNSSSDCSHKAMRLIELILKVPRMRAMYSHLVSRELSPVVSGTHSHSLRQRAASVLGHC